MGIEEHYNNYDEDNRMFSAKARKIEYLVTKDILLDIIKENNKVLELGAGEGVYTNLLKDLNIKLTSTDLIEKYVEKIRNKVISNSNVTVFQLDVKNLKKNIEEKFNVILCMGPYTHLQNLSERKKLSSDIISILDYDGIVILTYINKYFAHSLYLKYNMIFSKEQYNDFHNSNFKELADFDKFLDFTYYFTPEEIESELIDSGFEIIDHLGSDGFYNLMKDNIENMNDEQFSDLVSYYKSICRERSILGLSSHGLIVCKKGS
jgi:SAM-dependent methyltransferase